ncbi:MAG: S24/S26 family peptidase [Opitutaceae bacterium]|nr:S24/S26 family peptidase [Opitutaceae bacterium]
MAPTRPFLLGISCAAALNFCWVGTARARDGEQWIRGLFVGHSPPVQQIVGADARQQAEACAAQFPEAFVLAAAGESMKPLYSNGTILVCRRIAYAELERGMTILYRNQEHQVVAHLLVARARDGWRVAGLNNSRQDMEPVVADNLVGVVVAAFTPARLIVTNNRSR